MHRPHRQTAPTELAPGVEAQLRLTRSPRQRVYFVSGGGPVAVWRGRPLSSAPLWSKLDVAASSQVELARQVLG
jgi:hypothetical protein